jgi:hypothetical protein
MTGATTVIAGPLASSVTAVNIRRHGEIVYVDKALIN